MSWKIKTAAVLTFFSTALGMKAKDVPSEPEHGDSIRKEIHFKPRRTIEVVPVEKDSVPNDTIFTHYEKIADGDSIATTALQDSISCDSVPQLGNLEKFRACEYDMLCLIAHCEGVKTKAYWDPYGKVYTIGVGNTVRPDGRPVRRWDRIKDEQELMLYFSAHVEKQIFEPMSEVIEMENMTPPELVALTSFVYNCGVGCLRNYSKAEKKYVPTQFAQDLNEYFKTRSEESKAKVKAYMDKRITSKGRTLQQLVKRRDLEERVLFGDIILNNEGTQSEGNALDFSEIPLGGIYSIGKCLPADTLDLCKRLTDVPGKNLQDSIQSQFPKKQMQNVIYNKKGKSR